uniref:Uncharacterized protein n=1 Tax=Arundo donax TaxID=35708 RepID=A0A0A9FUB3_ARUDO
MLDPFVVRACIRWANRGRFVEMLGFPWGLHFVPVGWFSRSAWLGACLPVGSQLLPRTLRAICVLSGPFFGAPLQLHCHIRTSSRADAYVAISVCLMLKMLELNCSI